jgi:microcin C transport system permease protein
MVVANSAPLDFGLRTAGPDAELGQADWAGVENLTKWWLVSSPLAAMFVTLLLIVFIGEAVREAFDPREFSRLR